MKAFSQSICCKHLAFTSILIFVLLIFVFISRYTVLSTKNMEQVPFHQYNRIHYGRSDGSCTDNTMRVECFTSIKVHYGESLWTISSRYYTKDYKSMEHYIKRIKRLNHMLSEDVLAGAYLIIPYYVTVHTQCHLLNGLPETE